MEELKPRKKNVHNINCCVYGCSSRKGKNRNFHQFPKARAQKVLLRNRNGVDEMADARFAWIKILRLGKPVTIYMKVCSLHFKQTDYLANGICTNRPKLKPTAVPSLNLPKSSHSPRKSHSIIQANKMRGERVLNRRLHLPSAHTTLPIPELSPTMLDPVEEVTQRIHTSYEELSLDEQVTVTTLLQLGQEREPVFTSKTVDKCIQVTSGDFELSFTASIKTNGQLNSLTGIPNLALLNNFEYLATEMYPDKKSHKLSVKDRIVLTFMKLKLGLRFVVLAFLFKVSKATAKSIFSQYIGYLSQILKSCIYWPSKDECLKNMPQCFENFTSARIVLDCTEVPLQTTKCLCCRIRTYSHYKGGQTIKFMIGVSPAGLVTYVSKCFGGRSSDKSIFIDSGIVEKLVPGDSIMVDKGFLIQDVCNQHYIKVIQPHFLRKKKQFSREEALANSMISKARVHIERVNQRLKIFDIFKYSLPSALVECVDDMMIVICAMVNLGSPILSDDKF